MWAFAYFAFAQAQLGISDEMQQDMRRLDFKLGELVNELKESNSMRRDQQDLAVEVSSLKPIDTKLADVYIYDLRIAIRRSQDWILAVFPRSNIFYAPLCSS